MLENVRLGSDPEGFFVDQDGNVVSAIGTLGGTKDKPRSIGPGVEAVQEDNVLWEFNTNPTNNLNEWENQFPRILHTLREMTGLTPVVFPSYEFDKAYLIEQGAKAFVSGCDPDFNAWLDGKRNEVPNLYTTLRSAGGHIHVETTLNPLIVVRRLDMYVSIPMLFSDMDERRRELYGKAGAYRSKDYGVEYRTPSNHWLNYPGWVFEQVQRAVRSKVVVPEEVQDIINTRDLERADEIMTRYDIQEVSYD